MGGGDDHYTHPGCLVPQSEFYTFSHSWRYTPGVTAVWARELTLPAIIEGIQARRCYATTGPLILVDFSVNGIGMGGEVDPEEDPVIVVWAASTALLERVYVIRDGDIIYSQAVVGKKDKFAYRDRDFPSGTKFYCVCVTQMDGHIAWASPVFIRGQ